MIRKTILLLTCISGVQVSIGQVGIGTTTPDNSAVLEVHGTDKGFLMPRVADTSNVTSPATGLQVYDSGDNVVYYYDGTAWRISGFGSTDTDWMEVGDSLMRIVGTDTLMTITNSGKVGIGTTNPSTILSLGGDKIVSTDGSSNAINFQTGAANQRSFINLIPNGTPSAGIQGMTIWDADPFTTPANNEYVQFGKVVGGDVSIATAASGTGTNRGFIFRSGSVTDGNLIALQSGTGNVGIGTTTPSSRLDVYSDNEAIARFTRNGNGNIQMAVSAGDPQIRYTSNTGVTGSWYTGVENSFDGFIIGSDATLGIDPHMTILNSGDVGIGTTSPEEKLHVFGQINSEAADTLTGVYNYITAGVSTSGNASPALQLTPKDYEISGTLRNRTLIARTWENHSSQPDVFNIAHEVDGIRVGNIAINAIGNVGIGTTAPTARLDIDHVENTSDNRDMVSVNISGSGNGSHSGISSVVRGTGTGVHSGTVNALSGTGTGEQRGTANIITNSGNAIHRGVYNILSGSGSGIHIGVDNTIAGIGSGQQRGTYNSISNSGNGLHYGMYNSLTGSGTGTKYGTYTIISNTAGGQHFGVYSDVRKAGNSNYAGRFLGNVSVTDGNVGIGTTTPDEKLHIDAGNDSLQFENLAGTGSLLGIDANGKVYKADAPSGEWADSAGYIVASDALAGGNTVVVSDDGKIGVGTTTPASPLHIRSTDASTTIERVGQGAHLVLRSSQGTLAAPTASNNGDLIGRISGWSYDGTSFSPNAYIDVRTEEVQTATARGGNLQFFTTGLGTTSIQERMRITADGNVGIGTTTPDEKLHVDGNANIGGARISSNGTNSIVIGDTLAHQTNQTILGFSAGVGSTAAHQTAIGYHAGDTNTAVNQTAIGVWAGSRNTGIEQTALGGQAGRNNTGDYQTAVGYNAGESNTGHNLVAIGYGAGANNTADNQFIVKQNNVNTTPLIQGDFLSGNVGIGIAPTLAKLQVHHNSSGHLVYARNTANAFTGVIGTNVNSTYLGAINSDLSFQTNNVEAMRINVATQNVGIGTTTSPSTKLEVDGGSTTAGLMQTSAETVLRLRSESTDAGGVLRIELTEAPSTGNWEHHEMISFFDHRTGPNLIGRIAPTTAGTGTQYLTTSDMRLKHNIKSTQYSLSDLMSIKVKDYTYKSDKTNKVETGMLAQDLYEIFPDAVSVGSDEVDGDGNLVKPWTVDYGRLTPLLIKAIQELKAENDVLKAEVVSKDAQLKASIKDTQQRLETLEALLQGIASK